MFTRQQLTGTSSPPEAAAATGLVLHAEVDRGALEDLVDGADGAHLATHGASALGGGGGFLVALLMMLCCCFLLKAATNDS